MFCLTVGCSSVLHTGPFHINQNSAGLLICATFWSSGGVWLQRGHPEASGQKWGNTAGRNQLLHLQCEHAGGQNNWGHHAQHQTVWNCQVRGWFHSIFRLESCQNRWSNVWTWRHFDVFVASNTGAKCRYTPRSSTPVGDTIRCVTQLPVFTLLYLTCLSLWRSPSVLQTHLCRCLVRTCLIYEPLSYSERDALHLLPQLSWGGSRSFIFSTVRSVKWKFQTFR